MARSIKDSLELYDSSMKSVSNALVDKGVAGTSKLSEVAERIREIEIKGEPYLDKDKLADWVNTQPYVQLAITTSTPNSWNETVDLSVDGKGGVLGWVENYAMFVGTPNSGEKVKISDASTLFYRSMTYSIATLPAEDVLLTREYWDNYLDTLEVEEMAEAVPSVQLKQTLDLKGLNVSIGSVDNIENIESIEQIDQIELERNQKASIKEQVLNEIFDGDSINADVMPLATGNAFRNLATIEVTGLDTSECTTFDRMFINCSSLKSVPGLSSLNVSKVQSTSSMFYNNIALTTLDISSLKLDAVTSAGYMFSGCTSLTTLKTSSQLFSSSLTSLAYMFRNCSALKTLPTNINSWNMSSVTDCQYMFSGCTGLETIDLSSWTLTNCTSLSCMFSGCSSATSIDLRNATLKSTGTLPSSIYISGTFSGCSSVQTIYLNKITLKGTSANNVGSCFKDCSSLTKIVAQDWTSATGVSSTSSVFTSCSTKLKGGVTWSSAKTGGQYCCRTNGYFSAS